VALRRFLTFKLHKMFDTQLRIVFIEQLSGPFKQLDISFLMIDGFDFGLFFNFGCLGG